MAAAQLASLQVSDEGAAHILPAADPEALLKQVMIVGAGCHQQTPGPESQIVQGALELLQAGRGQLTAGDLGFQHAEHGADVRYLLAPCELGHGSLPLVGVPKTYCAAQLPLAPFGVSEGPPVGVQRRFFFGAGIGLLSIGRRAKYGSATRSRPA